MDGVAVKPLTVGFHETQFLGKLNEENQFGFWFQLSGEGQQQVGSPWGPSNPQALNRYSYVLNNPLRYTDPTGHEPGENAGNSRSYSYVRGAEGQEYKYNGQTYKADSQGRLYRTENDEKYYLMEACNHAQCKYTDSSSANFSQFKSSVDNMVNGIKLAAAAGVGALVATCLAALAPSLGVSCLAGLPIGAAVFAITFVATLYIYSGDADGAWKSMSSKSAPAGTYSTYHPRRRRR